MFLFHVSQMTLFIAGLGYNCLNTGYDCKNGGACDYFGRCKCPPGFKEYDCGLDSGRILQSIILLHDNVRQNLNIFCRLHFFTVQIKGNILSAIS